MAKITALPAAASVADTDLVPVVDMTGPTTEKATWATVGTLFAARTETLTNKTLTTPIMTTPRVQTRLDIDNPAGTFQYQITPAALAANRILNLPLLTGTDTVAVLALAQTFTNKTISGASNTISNLAAGVISSGTIATARGGTNLDTSGSTGVAKVAAGTWSVATIVNADVAAGAAIVLSKIVNPTGTGVVKATAGVFDAATSLILNADVNAAAAIAGTKISPDWGSQNTVTTGTSTANGFVQSGTTTNATAGGTINDCTLGGNKRIRFTDASGPTVTGFDATGIADGTVIYVYAGAATVAFTHEDAGSAAANRITLQSGITVNLAAGTITAFMYLTDGTNSRWRHLAATAI